MHGNEEHERGERVLRVVGSKDDDLHQRISELQERLVKVETEQAWIKTGLAGCATITKWIGGIVASLLIASVTALVLHGGP